MTHAGTAEQNIKHTHTYTHSQSSEKRPGQAQNGGIRIPVFASEVGSQIRQESERCSGISLDPRGTLGGIASGKMRWAGPKGSWSDSKIAGSHKNSIEENVANRSAGQRADDR